MAQLGVNFIVASTIVPATSWQPFHDNIPRRKAECGGDSDPPLGESGSYALPAEIYDATTPVGDERNEVPNSGSDALHQERMLSILANCSE